MEKLRLALKETTGLTEIEFIETAIEGGWVGSDEYGGEYTIGDHLHSIGKVLLDPLAWKAVGKVMGWERNEGNGTYPVFRDKIHQFIDNLIKQDL